MAIENVKKFFELVKSDEELAREIAKIKDEIQNKGETVDYEQIISKKVIPLAKEHGLDFTMEDFLKYTNSMVQQGELSDDDLLNVSGGMNLRQGLATGLLMLTVGTTGLSLMGNLTVQGGGDSGSGGSAPTTSYSQSINNDTEDEEDVDTESDTMEDKEFNDEDDITPTAKGASMDMLGAGMFDDSVSETDTQRGAGKSASTNKNTEGGGAAGGAASSASTNKNVAVGGEAGGAAKSTTTTKAKSDGAGGAAGATTTTTAAKKDEAKIEVDAEKKDGTKEEAKTEAEKKSEEAKKDEAVKTEASAKKDDAKNDEAGDEKKEETKEEAKTETETKSEEAAKKEADAVKKVEYTGLKRDVLTLKSFADKVETVNELAKVLKDSENGKNMSEESRAKLEADTLKIGFMLYDVNTKSFDVKGDEYVVFFEDGDEANIHAVGNYYKEISKDLKDFNDKGYTLEGKAENLVKELKTVNGEWYRFSPKTVKKAVQRINEVGNKIGQDDEGYYVNTAKLYGTTKTRFGEGEVEMIKTAADELANLAKK